MKLSDAGLQAIMHREGFRTVGYLDSRDIPTNGVGHAATGGPPIPVVGEVWSTQKVMDVLASDLAKYEDIINARITNPLTQNQFDACTSLAFNIGINGFRSSLVVAAINQGNYGVAADAFLHWAYPPELLDRRKGERTQFLRPDATGFENTAPRSMTIYEIQTALHVFDPTIAIDGDLGPQTLAAVKLFQRLHNLPVDGIAGQDTQKALLAGPPPSRQLIG